MTSHLGLMVLFAFFVSLIFAVIQKDQPHEQLRLGARMFAGFVGAGVILGWIMLVFPL
jgi:heme A synthase